MTEWIALPCTYPDEERSLLWTPYIQELRAAVSALEAIAPGDRPAKSYDRMQQEYAAIGEECHTLQVECARLLEQLAESEAARKRLVHYLRADRALRARMNGDSEEDLSGLIDDVLKAEKALRPGDTGGVA